MARRGKRATPYPDDAQAPLGPSLAEARRLLFIGERRSPTAVRMGVTWMDGRLCAGTLRAALDIAGIDPSHYVFANVYRDDGSLNARTLWLTNWAIGEGWTVVGLGQKVQRELTRAGCRHTPLIHPAARGAIRKTSAYQAHVAATLMGEAP